MSRSNDPLALRIGRIRHRVRQFVETLTAPFWPIDVAEAAACVAGAPDPASLVQLFLQMPRAEQRHGVLVCRRLRASGVASPDLLAAGLLHDAGKSVRPLCLWERVAVVLLEHYLPDVARWLSVGYPRIPFVARPRGRLRQALRVRRCHPSWGAKLAARAGATPRTVSLIRHHHASGVFGDEEVMALRNADET